MKTSDFNFELPENLVAQFPSSERGGSRLMVMDRKNRSLNHSTVKCLPRFLEKGTLLVFNNSRVRKARLIGVSRASGAKAEFLLVKRIDKAEGIETPFEAGCLWRVIARRASRRRPGSRYLFPDNLGAEIIAGAEGGEKSEFRFLKFDRPVDDVWLDLHGHMPLPPYIRRQDTNNDSERYQTVYARDHGSAAAPTAGLHFTDEIISGLGDAGMESVFVTLHVGLGTFLPVRTEDIESHTMHEETYFIDDETASRVEKAKAEGRKILAVGTTSVRTLESAWVKDSSGAGHLVRGEGSTSIFIYPGYNFRVVDAMFTNFHTPSSTLLMLVSAFAGRDFILESYMEAVRKDYRFFSYGDACLIL